MASPFSFGSYHDTKLVLLNEHESLIFRIPFPISHDIRRIPLQFGKIFELNKLKAMRISDLSPIINNTDKFIYATQISTPAVCETIRFIVEDEFGDACRVYIPGNSDTTHLQKGVNLAFANPVYRIALDGKYSLIVSNISDIYLIGLDSQSKTETGPDYSKQDLSLTPPHTSISGFSYYPKREILSPKPLLKSPQKTTNVVNPIRIERPLIYSSLFGGIKPQQLDNSVNSLQQQPEQQQPSKQKQEHQEQSLENLFQLQSCIDFPQSPEVLYGDGDNLNKVGIEYFKEGRYLQAVIKYTSAIQVNDKFPAFYSNRAMCFSKMGEFENALLDFKKICSLTTDNVQHQYCVALTYSRIGNHKQSLDLLKKLQPIAKEFLRPVEKLIREEEILVQHAEGNFDFDRLRYNFIESKQNYIADYIGPIQILNSPDKGRGIFTTRNVKKGEIICVVKAAVILRANFVLPCSCKFCRKILLKLYLNDKSLHPELIEKARKSKLTTVRIISLCDRSITNVNIDLYSGCGYEFAKNFDTTLYPMDKLLSLAENNIDVAFDFNEIASTYGITPDSLIPSLFYGIWLLPSFINHSCIPNVVKIYIGDICIVRAITDIPEGDEIFCSYIPITLFPDVIERAKFLKFQCLCKLCENSDFEQEISELIYLQKYLDTFIDPPFAFCPIKPQKSQCTEDLSKEKWLEIRNKVFKLARKLLLSESNTYFSVPFRFCIMLLLRLSFSQNDTLKLALEAEPYFSHYEPETSIIFWNSFYSHLKKTDNLKNPRFKHVEAKYNQTLKLFT